MTAVGERVVLTAAHCVANGAAGKVTVEGKAVSILCRHHPSYPGDHTADFALCSASGALERFERVNQDPSILKMGSSIQLLGYGCIAEGGRDRQFGILFEGTAKITQLTKNNLYTITRGGAAVCFGDSGGGAFLVQGQRRRLIGVNSRGDISTFSWLSTTSEKSFLDWAGAWASEQELMICGLHDGATGCRS